MNPDLVEVRGHQPSAQAFRRWHASRARGRRRQLLDPPGRNPGPGRRVGLGQEHHCPAAHAAGGPHGRRDALHADGATRDLALLSQSQYRPLRSDIQIIFQDPYASLNPRMRIREVLAEALDTHGLAKARRACRASTNCCSRSACGPSTRTVSARIFRRPAPAHRHCARAGGAAEIHRRRRAAVGAGRVDPGAGGQPAGRPERAAGLTLLFISHDLDVVEYLCDRVVVLYLGRVMEIAPTARRSTRNPAHPYTRALLAAAPVPDPALRRTIPLLQGDLPSPANPPSGCVFRTRCPHAVEACASADMQLRSAAGEDLLETACWRTDL
jgi:peptide/nickel transport system ATP-binding protein